jgi:hypothetical protein
VNQWRVCPSELDPILKGTPKKRKVIAEMRSGGANGADQRPCFNEAAIT